MELWVNSCLLTPDEISLAKESIAMALAEGAAKCRVTLSKSVLDLVGTLDGDIDKVQHCLDRSLSLALFADGRFGTFSTNRLEDPEQLRAFIRTAVQTVRMLAQDPLRDLPAPERIARDAKRGDESGTWDAEGYLQVSPEWLRETALRCAHFAQFSAPGFRMLSEEAELSVTATESLLLDSQGACCRSRETLFEYGVETTLLCEATGEKLSGYWWDSQPFLSRLDAASCAPRAAERAQSAAGAKAAPSGSYRIAVDTECASKLVTPLLTALGGFSLQQRNSFLMDALEKKIFSEQLTLLDRPRETGRNGARRYDSEGVAALDRPIIEKGVVKTYFINTYMAAKLGMPPTVEDAMRPVLLPTQSSLPAEGELLIVEGFNGGNYNAATGDFSYGIEGRRRFPDGHFEPFREMLMTGNYVDLWQHLSGVLDDARSCAARQIPTLLFDNVSCSGL